MATPSKKSTEFTEFLDNVTKGMFGRSRTESIESDICVECGGTASEFTDELSRKEYGISGLCQRCQDKVFTG